MGKLLTAMRHLPEGVVDKGWRVGMYPAGTALADALEQELILQGEVGYEIDLTTVTLLANHWLPTTADYLPDQDHYGPPAIKPDRGWRNMCTAPFSMTCIRYRRTRPGLFTAQYADSY